MPTLDPHIRADLVREELIREGHFAYRSGCHAGVLLDRDRLLSDPVGAGHMTYAVAKRFFTAHIETVATPSIWGAGMALWVANFLDPKAKAVYATPGADGPTIAPGLGHLIRDRRLLLVDNLIVTGETMRRFADLVAAEGGQVVGIAALWHAGQGPIAGREVFGLLNTHYPTYRAKTCPLCAAGAAPTKV